MPNGRTAALRRWIQSARNVRFLRLRSRKAYWPAFSTACLAMRMVFLRRPKKPLAALSTFLCLAWEVTPRLTRAMIQISGKGLAVRQEEFLDLVAVGLEQHRRAAQITDLLGRALDHTVAPPALGIDDLAGPGNFEALFRARFGLQLGHLALLRASRPFEFGGAKDPGCLG